MTLGEVGLGIGSKARHVPALAGVGPYEYRFRCQALEVGLGIGGRCREVKAVEQGLFDAYLQGMVDDALRIVDKEPAERYAAMAARPVVTPSIDLPPATNARGSYERWDLEELELIVQSAKGTRSFSNGRLAFARARCADCHVLGGAGGSTGPDLTTAASRFSTRDLLEAIVKPSRVISDQYQDTEVLLKDERLLVGRVVRGEDGKVQFHGAPPAEEKLEFAVDEVELVRPSPLSRMPEGLLDPLTDVEVLDLLYFIMSAGVPPE